MEKQKRFHSAKHGGTITFSLGKRFSTKARANVYAKNMRGRGYNARVVIEDSQYAVYTRRER